MFHQQRTLASLALTLLLLLAPARGLHAQQEQQWRPVAGGILLGISGMALIAHDGAAGRSSFLVIHDNKNRDEPRAGVVTVERDGAPRYATVEWPKDSLPVDLEALSAVPGRADTYLALASSGTVFHVRLDASRRSLSVLKVFNLPNIPAKSNFESLTLQSLGQRTLAVWAHRGEDEDPAVIYWALFDAGSYAFTQAGSARLSVPWKGANVRHISDLKLDASGTLYATSASDPGNDGPFDSVFYVAGAFQITDGRISFAQNSAPARLARFAYHKIEALELVPGRTGGVVFGTDDENMGSSVYLDW